MKSVFCFLLLCLSQSLFSQQKIEGKIVDATKHPVAGAMVLLKGTTIGTSTDASGKFSFTISDSLIKTLPEIKLVVSFVGYQDQELNIGNSSTEALTILLKENPGLLTDVVVIGYGLPAAVEEVVSFPWPPPDFSARMTMDKNLFGGAKNLFDVDKKLSSALVSSGYSEKAYYYVPNGFALVTRIEQINSDGEPLAPPARWSIKVKSMTKLSWANYIKALFFSTVGHFRIIVFIVTDKPFAASGKKIKRSKAVDWLKAGLNSLPRQIGTKNFGSHYECTAVIYEFEKVNAADAILRIPGQLAGDEHLKRSAILSALMKK